MSHGVGEFFGVMMTLMFTGLIGYAGVSAITAFNRRSRRTDPGIHPAELDEIRGQLAEVDQLRERVSELEGRLDFAERLMSRQQEAARIEGGTRSVD